MGLAKPRHLAPLLLKGAAQSPIVVLTGPRQSGKTTLVREVFASKPYLSLEDPDVRARVVANPREFLAAHVEGAVFDEAQKAPELFSYLQTEVDRDQRPGRFILTGSENLSLSERISQSLAGRTVLFRLLPFSYAEWVGRAGGSPDRWHVAPDSATKQATPIPWAEAAFRGFFPRAVAPGADARQWLGGFLETYVERDVRQVVNVGDLEAFRRFLRLAAGRSGQLLNYANLAVDAGVGVSTARSWLSVLEATYVVRLLPPFHENFNKRLVKTPKLYFTDTGLMCRLLGLRSPDDLATHPLRGAIFETLIFGEAVKTFLNAGEQPPLYFWRDRAGHEVDLIVDLGSRRVPIEIKAAEIVRDEDSAPLRRWCNLAATDLRGVVVHAGDATSSRSDGVVLRSWRDLS